jgi:hypothetical protein
MEYQIKGTDGKLIVEYEEANECISWLLNQIYRGGHSRESLYAVTSSGEVL